MYKIIGADQKEYGPISAEQMRQWIAEGRVNAQTQVKNESASSWQSLGQAPEFAALFPGTKGPPPLPQSFAPKPSPTSGMAISSLVLGILGLFTCGVGSLLGLIFGIVALSKIRKSGGRLAGSGLAIAGICVSGCFVLMLPVWAGLLLPALAKAKEKALTINCANNIKHLDLAVLIYAGDHNDQFPTPTTWCDAILGNAGGASNLFRCPADPGQRSGYAFNARLAGKKTGDVNPATVMIFESDAGWNANGGAELMRVPPRHGRTSNVGFADGHVEGVSAERLQTLRWNP